MNGDNVGGIYYDASFDVDAMQRSADAVEQIAENTSKQVELLSSSLNRSVSQQTSGLDKLESDLSSIIAPVTAVTAAIATGFGAAAVQSFNQVRAVENASFALRAYEKDGNAVNKVLGQLVAYARSDLGTLFQREELFQAASNLKGFGESTANLTSRVETLSKGVALGMTTFDELSQIIGRSAQQGRLTAEAYDQLASRGIILDQSFRGTAVAADQLYNELERVLPDSILEGRANTIDGQLIRLQTSFRDLGAQILGVDRNTSQFIQGGLGSALVSAIGQLSGFVNANQQAIINVGAFVVSVGGMIAGAYGAVKALAALRVAMTLIAAHPVVAVISLLGGLLGALAVDKMTSGLQESNDAGEDLNDTILSTENNLGGAADEADNLGKKLKSIAEQEAKIRRDYRENLANLVRDTQDSIKNLTGQLKEEEAAYRNTYQKRLLDFQTAQTKEEESHEKKTSQLQAQIDFLRRYDNDANRRKLSELQFALAKENNLYATQTDERKKEFDLEAEAQRLSYIKRRDENQARLNEETALLNKHRNDVNAIRDVILLDEIEKLKRSRDEQLKSLQQQRSDAVDSSVKGGIAAGGAFGREFGDKVKAALDNTKVEMNNSLSSKSWIRQLQDNFQSNWERNNGDFWKPMRDSFNRTWGLLSGTMEIKDGKIITKGSSGGWQTGGFTGVGGSSEVAGAVHRGEYVLPKSMVDQSTRLPKPEAIEALSGGSVGSGDKYYITVNGGFLSNKTQQRDLADMIQSTLQQKQKARGMA